MKLKSELKLMAAAVALIAATGANAAVTNSQGGNGGLFFTIYDAGVSGAADDDRAYVRNLASLANGSNLGGLLNNWASATTTSPLPALPADKQGFGTIFSMDADANLQSFLTASTNTSRLKWNIAAVDSAGTDRLLTTAASVVAPNYNAFRSVATAADSYLAAMNPSLSGQSALYNGAASSINLWGDNIAGKIAFSNTTGLGGSQGFFVLSERVASGSTTTLADVRQFKADASTDMQWKLANNGNLSYGAVAAIPEPSEYALMLAGLGMLAFIARRRNGNRG